MLAGLIAILFLSHASAHAGDIRGAIYGSDDRKNYYEADIPGWLKDRAFSSPALVNKRDLEYLENDRYLLHHSKTEFCSDEAFANEFTFASCSAVLIAPRIVLTAGHCFYPSSCNYQSFVFGIWKSAPVLGQKALYQSQIYNCKSVIAHQAPRLRDSSSLDYAIIELDRDVSAPYRPAPIAKNFHVEKKSPLYMVGYPKGLPLKFSPGLARHTSEADERMIETNLDAYAGNSGSPVFNEKGEVLGLLVNGVAESKRANSCFRSRKCDDDSCSGEYVMKVQEILPLISVNTRY